MYLLEFLKIGNAAWACIKAKEKILIDSSIGSEEFFITDDTPLIDPYDFLLQFIESRNYKLSKHSVPYVLVQFILLIVILLIKLIKPIYKFKLPIRYNPSKIQYFCTTHFFNRNKATLRLDYNPLFNEKESLDLSLDYYKNLSI